MLLNAIAAKPLSHLLFGKVSWRVFSTLDEFIALSFSVLLLMSLFYVLLRLYEETLAKRAKRFSRQSFLEGGWKLTVKLLIGGVIVFVLTLSLSASDWVKKVQYFLDQPSRFYGGRETNDSIGIVFVYSEGKSHEWYFNTMHRICSGLRDAGAKAVLVPLPPRFTPRESNAKSLERISKLGLTVFAIPPVETGEYAVSHPMNNKVGLDWGVTSVGKHQLPSGIWPYPRFYPLAFRETNQGDRVPDAAIQIVRKFLGEGKEIAISTEGQSFKIGRFQIGLYTDESAPIFNRLNQWSGSMIRISGNENSNSLEYFPWPGGDRMLKTNALSKFKEKIVVIDPGETIAPFLEFGFTYSMIIHQILREYSVTPLDRWTFYLVAAFILVAIAMFWLYRPWIASLVLIFLTVGQGFLYSWMNSHFGLVVEAVPLFITGVFSIGMFVFVRVNHERSMLHVAEKHRALQELQTAHDMQLGLMPTSDPVISGFEISGLTKAADEVGGDFFDYVWLDEAKTRLGIAVADVSGKAMKAAMTAVLASGMVYRELGSRDTPKIILSKINKPLYVKTDKRIFTAMTFALVDSNTKTLTFSNAGQMLPLLKRKGQVQSLQVKGPRLPLGIVEDVAYEETRIQLESGDGVILYTDGIPEAMNEQQELYGFERFDSLVSALPTGLSAKEISQQVMQAMSEFTKEAVQHDDMTIVVIRVV